MNALPLADTPDCEETVKRVRVALGPRKGRLTTVQATLVEYESSWNRRELGRLMRCYSRVNRLRKLHDRDPDARRRLASQLNDFSGELELSLLRVMRSPASITASQPHAAKTCAEVEIAISGDSFRDRMLATMEFVREGGEWLLLDDGL